MNRESLVSRFVAAILFFWAVEEVGAASLSISRDGCGKSKLCVETPASCDPSGTSSCLFMSVAVDESQLNVSLRGDSTGYIALGLTNDTQDEGVSTLFACALNGSEVFLKTAQSSGPNGTFTDKDMSVMNFEGDVKDSVMHCGFSVPLSKVKNLKSSDDMIFTVLLGNGTVDTNYSLEAFTVSQRTDPLDLMKFKTEAPAPTGLSITRDGCGESKLCVETPKSCDPNVSGSCLFSSAAVKESKLSLSLRGDSAGYVALGLTKPTQDTSLFFVCGKRNGTFFFETAQVNNSVQNATFTKTNTVYEELQSEVSGNVTKCAFKILNTNVKSRSSSDFAYKVTLGKGEGDTLDSMKKMLETKALDLSDPKANSKSNAVRPAALLSALILPILLTVTLNK